LILLLSTNSKLRSAFYWVSLKLDGTFPPTQKPHHSLSNLTKKKQQYSSRIRKKEHCYINNNNRVKKEEQQLEFNNK
jgi:hypothetical protein